MKKKILIGSIIAVVLLLLMPSIPAIQQNTIENEVYNKSIEQIEEIKTKDAKEIMPLDDDIKHPLLLRWVTFRFDSMIFRSFLFISLSATYEGVVISSLLFNRGWSLGELADAYSDFWEDVSITYGWGWFED